MEKSLKKIKKNWNETIRDDDVVIIPGDFSWAIEFEGSFKDFEYLNNLPGKKLF